MAWMRGASRPLTLKIITAFFEIARTFEKFFGNWWSDYLLEESFIP